MLFSILLRVIWADIRDYREEFDLTGWATTVDAMASLDGCVFTPSLQPLNKEALKENLAFAQAKAFLPMETRTQKLSLGLYHLLRDLCHSGVMTVPDVQSRNKIVLLAIVWIYVLLARILSRSWLFSIGAGAVMLSRGSFISSIGVVSPALLLGFCHAASLLALAHTFRSGSRLALFCYVFFSSLGIVFDPKMLLLNLGLPVFILLSAGFHKFVGRKVIAKGGLNKPEIPSPRSRSVFRKLIDLLDKIYGQTLGDPKEDLEGERARLEEPLRDAGTAFFGGRLFRPSKMRYSIIFETGEWKTFFFAGLVTLVLSFFVLHLSALWLPHVSSPIEIIDAVFGDLSITAGLGSTLALLGKTDIHLLVSFLLIVAVIFQPKKTILSANRPFSTLLLIQFFVLMCSQAYQAEDRLLLAASISGQPVPSGIRNPVAFFEPTLLAIGLVSVRVLLRSVRQRAMR